MRYIKTILIVVFLMGVFYFTVQSDASINIEQGANNERPKIEVTGATGTIPIVNVSVNRPPRVHKKVVKFRPWGKPTIKQVFKIINYEAQLWNTSASRISCRIDGESSYEWDNSNGKYLGLGQFADETFYRGMSSIGTRKVRIVRKRKVNLEEVTTTVYIDGSKKKKVTDRYKGTRIMVKKGTIPRNPERTHGWAQVRIMARSQAGLGRVNIGEWSVKC